MKGATLPVDLAERHVRVSIRAPREGGDMGYINYASQGYVSIRAPREGGDERGERRDHAAKFQSAPPVKGATGTGKDGAQIAQVSIRAPREGGDR